MAPDTLAVLRQLGIALDEQQPLRVRNRGLIVLGDQFSTGTPAEENGDDRQGKGKRGPATRSWERTTPRKGAARGSRKASARPRVVGDVLRAAYEGQVTQLVEAYPTLQTFQDEDGMWFLAKSSIISGLTQEATFLVALPYRSSLGPRSWGFWTAAGQFSWIGPRHTNFEDGSVCAFSPDDGAWSEGDDLRTLLDLYSVWALRHLHLEVLGRWPGKQYSLYGADPALQAYYRRIECKDDELCACGSVTRRYAECCKLSDVQLNLIELMSRFAGIDFKSRRPPSSIIGFLEGRSDLPRMADVHLQFDSQ